MTAEPGWYPYPGDPDGTVRRWNGTAWVGFPAELPSELSDAAETNPLRRQALPNQRRLLPLAVFGAGGLLITIFLGIVILANWLSVWRSGLGRTDAVTAWPSPLRDPFGDLLAISFVVFVFVGGVLFLGWLWTAHENLGGRTLPPQPRLQFTKWTLVASWLFRLTIFPGRLIFGPVISRMANLVDYSGDGPEAGKLSTLEATVWWTLWLYSAGLMVTGLVFISVQDLSLHSGLLGGFIVLLAGHLVSLAIAVKLIIQISIFQDRRLDHGEPFSPSPTSTTAKASS